MSIMDELADLDISLNDPPDVHPTPDATADHCITERCNRDDYGNDDDIGNDMDADTIGALNSCSTMISGKVFDLADVLSGRKQV